MKWREKKYRWITIQMIIKNHVNKNWQERVIKDSLMKRTKLILKNC